MSWTLGDTRPIYLQLSETIRQRIASGFYPEGSKIPSVRDLAREASVNPNTMQRAFSEPEAEDLIITQGTNGRFITQDKEKISAVRERLAQELIEKFIADMESIGINKQAVREKIKIIEVSGNG